MEKDRHIERMRRSSLVFEDEVLEAEKTFSSSLDNLLTKIMITNEISNFKTKEKELLLLVQSLEKNKHDLNLIKINEFNTLNEDLTSSIDTIKKEIVAFKLYINSLQKDFELN